MEPHQLREAIDACRFDSDDLQQPEFAELAETLKRDEQTQTLLAKVQHVDAAIREACHDVEVPADLASRLQAAVATVSLPESPAEEQAEQSPARPAMRRRALLVVAALASVFLLTLTPLFWTKDNLDSLALAEEAQQWPGKSQFVGPWQLVVKPFSSRPYSENLTSKPVKWRRYKTRLDGNAAVYLDDRSYQSDVLLFVMKTSQGKQLSFAPPSNSIIRTGTRQIAVWKERDCVYVLIIDGPDEYRRIAPRRPGLA